MEVIGSPKVDHCETFLQLMFYACSSEKGVCLVSVVPFNSGTRGVIELTHLLVTVNYNLFLSVYCEYFIQRNVICCKCGVWTVDAD